MVVTTNMQSAIPMNLLLEYGGNMDPEKLTDQELIRQLENARMANILLNSEEWGLVRECMKRVFDKHVAMLIDTSPNDQSRIMELQHICKLYREEFLPQLIHNMRLYGPYAFEEIEKRGGLQKLMDKLTAWAKGS